MAKRVFWEKFVCAVEEQMSSDGPEESGQKIAPTTFSPHGLIPITSPMLYTKHLDLWNCHANFDITEDLIFQINEVPGVEVLMPTTRYSFRVGFKTKARLFNIEDVKNDIEIVCGTKTDELSNFTQKQREHIRNEKKIVESFPYWMIFVFPNGRVYSISSEIYSKDFLNQAKIMKETKEKIGGVILESDYIHVRRVQNGKT